MAQVADVVNFLIDIGLSPDEEFMTNMRLNKLLYFIQAHHLVKHDKPLFDDDFEAWPYGPVIDSVYHAFKKYRENPIMHKESYYDSCAFTPEEQESIFEVLREYGRYSTPYLVTLSHKHGSPWDITVNDNQGSIIDKDLIQSYHAAYPMISNKPRCIRSDIEIVKGRRDKDGVLVLPRDAEDDWEL